MSTFNKVVYYDSLTVTKLKIGDSNNQLVVQNNQTRNSTEPIVLNINNLLDIDSNVEIYNKTIDVDEENLQKNTIKNLGVNSFKPINNVSSPIIINSKGGEILETPSENSVLYYDITTNSTKWIPLSQIGLNQNQNQNQNNNLFNQIVGNFMFDKSLLDDSDLNQQPINNYNLNTSKFNIGVYLDNSNYFELPYRNINNKEIFSMAITANFENNCTLIKNSNDSFKGYDIILKNNKINIKIGNGITWNTMQSNTEIMFNNWYHITIVYDNVNIKLYLNGILDCKSNIPLVPNNSNNLILGRDKANIIGNYFLGHIALLKIYDGIITDTEIENLNLISFIENSLIETELEPEPEPEPIYPNFIVLHLLKFNNADFNSINFYHKQEISQKIEYCLNQIYSNYQSKINITNADSLTLRIEIKIYNDDYLQNNIEDNLKENLNNISNKIKNILGGINSINECQYIHEILYSEINFDMEPELEAEPEQEVNYEELSKDINISLINLLQNEILTNVNKVVENGTNLYILTNIGKIYVLDITGNPVLQDTLFLDISSKINTNLNTGLVNLLFNPINNNKIYIYYLDNTNNYILVQYLINNNIIDLDSETLIYKIASNNNISDVCFDNTDLYLSLGDKDDTQSKILDNPYGKIIKFNIIDQIGDVSITIGNTKLNHNHIVLNSITVDDINNWQPNINYSKTYSLLDTYIGHTHTFTIDSDTFEKIKQNVLSSTIITSSSYNNHLHNISIDILNYQVVDLSLFTFNATIGNNHNHTWPIENQPTIDDINGNLDKSYTIYSNDHSHTIMITKEDFSYLRNGKTITVTITEDDHNHTINITLTNRSIQKISATILTNVAKTDTDTSHNHTLTIPYSDLVNNLDKTYTISTFDNHNHTVTMTKNDIINLRNGNTIYPLLSSQNNHTHIISIKINNLQNYTTSNNLDNSLLGEIYSYGYTNPKKLFFNDQIMYTLDHDSIYEIKSGLRNDKLYKHNTELSNCYLFTTNRLGVLNNSFIFLSDNQLFYKNTDVNKLNINLIDNITNISIGKDDTMYVLTKNNIYKMILDKWNPIDSFIQSSNIEISARKLDTLYSQNDDSTNITSFIKSYLLETDDDNFYLAINNIPNYKPSFRNTLLLGNWSNNLTNEGIDNSLVINNYIGVQNYGWTDTSNIQYGNPLKIPINPVVSNNKYWSDLDSNWKYNTNNQEYQGAIGISINGILLCKTNLNNIYDNVGGKPNNQNIYNYSKYIGFLEDSNITNDYQLVTHLNDKILKKGVEGHSKILGYAFDGYPIYGPIGFVDKMSDTIIDIYNRNVKIMKSSFILDNNEYKFIEGLGDLDKCNGIFSPTPEYPEGIYHYHMTIESNIDGTVKTKSDPFYSGINEIEGNNVVSPSFPYILNNFYGVPNSECLFLPQIDVSYNKYDIELSNPKFLKYNTYDDKLYILEDSNRIIALNYNSNILDTTINEVLTNSWNIICFDFHSDFINNNLIYLSCMEQNNNNIIELDLNNPTLYRTIYSIKINSISGPNLLFGTDDNLYLSFNDGGGKYDNQIGHTWTGGLGEQTNQLFKDTGNLGNAQDLSNIYGKIIRINVSNIISNNVSFIFSFNEGFVVDNSDVKNQDITLYRGNTYTFSYQDNLRYNSIEIVDTNGDIYNSIQNNYINELGYGFDFTFTLPLDCPEILYYRSQSNPLIKGSIIVESLYKIPETNPYNESETYKKEIYAWGFRDPINMTFDILPSRNDHNNEKRPYRIIVNDIGSDEIDSEINIILPIEEDIKNMNITLYNENSNISDIYYENEVTNSLDHNYGWRFKNSCIVNDDNILPNLYNNNDEQYNQILNQMIDPIFTLNSISKISGVFIRKDYNLLNNKYIIIKDNQIGYLQEIEGSWKYGNINNYEEHIDNIFKGKNNDIILVSNKDIIRI